jgi:hypothetical protein
VIKENDFTAQLLLQPARGLEFGKEKSPREKSTRLLAKTDYGRRHSENMVYRKRTKKQRRDEPGKSYAAADLISGKRQQRIRKRRREKNENGRLSQQSTSRFSVSHFGLR